MPNKKIEKKSIVSFGLSNYKDRIEKGELSNSKTIEQWLELNIEYLKLQKVVGGAQKEIHVLDTEITKLSQRRQNLMVHKMQAEVSRQRAETTLINGIICLSDKLTKLEREVMNAIRIGEWNSEECSLDKLPYQWQHNEKYLNALSSALTKISS